MRNKSVITNCPLRKALQILGGKWNLIIIKTIGEEELRLNEIKKQIPDISEKVLIDKLKVLAEGNLVLRKNFNEIPPKVSYRLSEKGLEALKICVIFENFGKFL